MMWLSLVKTILYLTIVVIRAFVLRHEICFYYIKQKLVCIGYAQGGVIL
jgi:hypothetical protein